MAKILFVQLSSFELNGFQAMSAVLKNAGHDTDVVSLSFEKYNKLIG